MVAAYTVNGHSFVAGKPRCGPPTCPPMQQGPGEIMIWRPMEDVSPHSCRPEVRKVRERKTMLFFC